MPIERIEVFVTDLPTRLRRQTSSGAYDTGAPGTILGKPVLVKIYADGVVGYGQVRPISPGHFLAETVHSVVGAITDIYGPLLLGRDLFDLESMGSTFDRVLPGNPNARAVLDHAIHDAMGKALDVPVYKLLGGLCQPRIPLEWSVSMADEQEVMIAEACRAVEEFGIRVLCLKAGGPGGWQQDVKNFAAVRSALGDDVVLGVDPNTAWSVSGAIRATQAMMQYGLGYVEQPIERRDLAGLAAIRSTLQGIPLMADESLFTLQDAYALAEAHAVDALCIKLYKTGGLQPAKKIAAVAEAANMKLNIGGLAVLSQLEAAAAAHFYASTPEHRVLPAAEFLFGLGVIGPDPLVPVTEFVCRDGYVEPPRGPGLGVAVDNQAIKRYTLRREVVKK